MNRACRECGASKRLATDYYLRQSTGKHDAVCKTCRRSASRTRHARLQETDDPDWRACRRRARKKRLAYLRETVNTLKAKPCLDCGQSFPYYVMHFDHLDGSDKEGDIGRMVSKGISLERVLAEIAKCELVCSNCHHVRTWKRNKKTWRE